MKQKLAETPLSISDVRHTLAAIKEKEGELNYRAGKTYEYLEQFAKLDAKEAKKLADELTKLEIPRVKEQHIIKLIDVLPTTAKDVKTVLQGYAVTVTNDNLQKIADVIVKYAPLK
jgi:DNA-directed RNA polymerase subunit F